jgi:hypothetical protein
LQKRGKEDSIQQTLTGKNEKTEGKKPETLVEKRVCMLGYATLQLSYFKYAEAADRYSPFLVKLRQER